MYVNPSLALPQRFPVPKRKEAGSMMEMNQVQLAWIRAIEKKLARTVEVKSEEDIRVLARMAVQTYSPEVLLSA